MSLTSYVLNLKGFGFYNSSNYAMNIKVCLPAYYYDKSKGSGLRLCM